MVDFNNESTISTPAADIVRVLILQRRNDVIEAIESHRKKDSQGVETDLAVIKARLYSFWLEVQASLKRHLIKAPEEYEELKEEIFSNDFNTLVEAFTYLNEWLDFIKLTRIDTRRMYDSTLVELENKEKGI